MPTNGIHQLFEHLRDGKDLLLTDAKQVVIERRSRDDRLRGVFETGCRVDHDRRVARSRNDRPPLARQRGPGHSRAAGDDEELDSAVIE